MSERSRFGHKLAMALVLAALGLAVVSAQAPQPQPARIDLEALGPKVGSRVPEFSLPDQFGRTQTLTSIMGPKGAMLVCSRSADW